jgi:hypothetical protein
MRWGLPEDFPCPYAIEGCQHRGKVLAVENKVCCGGKMKVTTTYECTAGMGGGKVTIENCLSCPIRNRRRMEERKYDEVPATVSPWGDPARRLMR